MGGMKSGTGDVWDSDDEEEPDTEAVEESEADVDAADADPGETAGREQEGTSTKQGQTSVSGRRGGVGADSEVASGDDIAKGDSSTGGAGGESSGSDQPYIVRRMLRDKSVQFERDERLTFFVHDDVKAGEQELEAETQDLFGRDIPVFDIREAVYRAALQNRDDVVDELEQMGYTRD